jgi:hypothetical protein
VVAALAVSAAAQSTRVLTQSEIEELEIKVAQNPEDRESQTLLGRNYALFSLGITGTRQGWPWRQRRWMTPLPGRRNITADLRTTVMQVFIGHMVLGQVALRRGDIASARQHLLASGRTPGSPVLSSFGPRMSLAKELLDAGERQAVLEFLGLCGKFWLTDFGKLTQWSAEVEQGRVPNFGANLH